MSTLSTAVQEAIKNDLPGLVAAELKEFVARAEKNEGRVQLLTDQLGSRDAKIRELTALLEAHKEVAIREQEVANAVAAQQVREIELRNAAASLDAQIARAELQGVKDTANLFLRNTIFRESVVSDVAKPVEGSTSNVPGQHSYPGMLQRDAHPDVTTTTRETE